MDALRSSLSAVSVKAHNKPNLYLVGFMGTGKSTIGRRVADELGMQFVDSDHTIERLEQRSIPEIFEADGEAAFREMERQFIEGGHHSSGVVVSCGGGLAVQGGMLQSLQKKGIVICLIADVETILQRVSGNANRPLLEGDAQRERIEALMSERAPIYAQVRLQIMTDHRATWEVVQHVKRCYLEACQVGA
ncbi:MAG: shikimate kinase [Opitutales bacterium]|nr:shikimate kinase [Opitutales bacterium]NRA26959.1 shikimate kinase [Opitutales bacterium]